MSFATARRGAVLLLIPVLALSLAAGARAEEPLLQDAAPAEGVTFAGMKMIPGGEFEMGIDVKALVKLYGDPNKKPTRKHHKLLTEKDKMEWWELLLHETPAHDVTLGDYAIDTYTVTNAQYLKFLEESQKASFFTRTKVNTIDLVAKEVYGEERLEAWNSEAIFWINEKRLLQRWEEIKTANEPRIKAILTDFNAFLPEKAKKADYLDLPDKQRAEGWVQFLLPDGIALTIYNRPIPDHWLKPEPTDDDDDKKKKEYVPRKFLTKEMENWPVVNVTAVDADAFAEWAGKHVPSEAEYEKAARGPKGFLYPWGDSWDWKKERNRLVWRDAEPEKKGPAAPFRNRAVDVTRCADSASPYGVMHMLGNVREWTSSFPQLYKGCTAEKESWFGSKFNRVLRSTSFGDGATSDGKGQPNLELMHRNTARALGAAGKGFSVTSRYDAVGFRCAKLPQPARDVLLLRQRAMLDFGSLKTVHGEKYGADRAYGVERNQYDPSGGGNHTYVTGHTTVLGVVPLDRSTFAQAQDLIDASAETDPTKGGPQMFAWIYWNGDLKIEIMKEKVIQPEAPAEEGAEEGAEGAEKAGETEKKDDPKKDKKKDKKKKKKRPGKKAPEEEPEEPAGPTIEQTREFLAGHPDHPYFLGIVSGRLAIFELKAQGVELIGYLPAQTASGASADAPAVLKAKEKSLSDTGSASIDAEKGFVRLRMTTKTRSQTASDVFVFDVVLKVQGTLTGTWRNSSR